jgi:hypothetical protein
MKIPAMAALAAVTFCTVAYATPALRLSVNSQQQINEIAPNATETGGGVVERIAQQAGWLWLISGDDDDARDGDDDDNDDDNDESDHDDDETGCGTANRTCQAAPTKGPIAPPQNGLFNTGQAPLVKIN